MKFNVAAMHSDLEQSQREEVMKEFKNGRIDILVATDVVSRGIDINDIKLVINFDIPTTRKTTCTASAVPPAEQTAKDWPSLSFQPKNNSNSNASKNSWIRKSIKYRSIPNSAKHLYTSPKNTQHASWQRTPRKDGGKGKSDNRSGSGNNQRRRGRPRKEA